MLEKSRKSKVKSQEISQFSPKPVKKSAKIVKKIYEQLYKNYIILKLLGKSF